MKNISIIILFFLISFWGCRKEDEPQTPIIDSQVKVLKTHNIKTAGPQYFSFETSDTTSNSSSNWDISFEITPIYYQTDDTKTWMKINDPVIKTGKAELARLEGQSFDDLKSLPSGIKFRKDSSASAYIGKTWLDANNNIKNNVYIISTTINNTTKYYALAIKSYVYDPASHQITSIKFYFKEIKSGATVDTVSSVNPYTTNYYYSLQNKAKATDETNCDFYFKGSELWLGLYSKVLVLENKTIDQVTSVPTGNFVTDKMESYVSMSWYEYNSTTHLLTPKKETYIAKLLSGKYAAFKIVSYYGDDGKSGSFTINWKWIQ